MSDVSAPTATCLTHARDTADTAGSGRVIGEAKGDASGLHAVVSRHLSQAIGGERARRWLEGIATVRPDQDAAVLRVGVPSAFAARRVDERMHRALEGAAAEALGPGAGVVVGVSAERVADAVTTRSGSGADPEAAKPAEPAPGLGRLPSRLRRHLPDRPASSGAGGTGTRGDRRGEPLDAVVVPGTDPGKRRARRNPFARSGKLHRLDDFIVCPANELAYAAVHRVASADEGDPSLRVPLFLYGGCGLGKTHLLQSLCRETLRRRPEANVLYATAEHFTNLYIDATRAGKLPEFRQAMRDLDLLAIDDVQFLVGKEKTQIEFMHCFDEIEMGGGPVAMAADRHPHQIQELAEKLRSRCVRGPVVQLHPLDPVGRRALLVAFAKRMHLDLAPPALDALVPHAGPSVRELHGLLSKLHALAWLCDGRRGAALHAGGEAGPGTVTVGLHLIRRLLQSDAVSDAPGPTRLEDILRVTADAFGLEPADIMARSRKRPLVQARGLVIRLARRCTRMSYPEIARALNRPNHSTVITADQRVTQHIEAGDRFNVPTLPEPVCPSVLLDRLEATLRNAA